MTLYGRNSSKLSVAGETCMSDEINSLHVIFKTGQQRHVHNTSGVFPASEVLCFLSFEMKRCMCH